MRARWKISTRAPMRTCQGDDAAPFTGRATERLAKTALPPWGPVWARSRSLAARLRASGRDGSRETEIGKDRTGDQVERDVELADVEESKRVGDKDTDQAQQQQDHAHDLAEPP